MVLFHLDPDRNQRKIQRFEKICGGNQTLVNCYRNRLTFGCRYHEIIERRIDAIVQIINKHEDPPSWVSLLD